MLLVEEPQTKNNLDALRHFREDAERVGVTFDQLTLTDAVTKSRDAVGHMDIGGHLAWEMLARFVATIISVVEYEDEDEGHAWLHSWMAENGLGKNCMRSLTATKEFGSAIHHFDSLNEAMIALRVKIADMTSMKEGLGRLSEHIANAVEQADAGYVARVLDHFSALFAQYETPENAFAKVIQVCNALEGVAPARAIETYLHNGLMACNWGLTEEAFAAGLLSGPIQEHFDFQTWTGEAQSMLSQILNDDEDGHPGSVPTRHSHTVKPDEEESDSDSLWRDGGDLADAFKDLFGDEDE